MRTFGQGDQIVNDAALARLGKAERTQLKDILAALDLNTDSPMRMSAAFPTPDAKLYIAANTKTMADGTKRTSPPTKSQIPTVVDTTIDFQTGTVTGATVDLVLPTSVVGQFRRVGFTLLATGTIKALVSIEAASVGSLVNPGTLFVKSGIPIGYIDLECTQASPARFKSAGAGTNVITANTIYAFGAGGGGGGSGTGDSSSLEEEIKARLRTSRFLWATPNVFSKHETARVDVSTTADSQITEDNLYLFANGDFLLSTQHFDAPFLASDRECGHAELMAFWDPLAIDPAAIYQLSRDGINFQTLSMSRVGTSNTFRGYHVFADETSHSTLATQASGGTLVALNATTTQKRSQSFVVTDKSRIRRLSLYLSKTGSPSGSLYVQIVKNNAGQPSTNPADILYESSPISAAGLAAGASTLLLTMTKPLVAGTYHIVILTDDAYKTGFSAGVHQVSLDSANNGGTTDSSAFNGTTWSTVAGTDLKFLLEGMVYNLRVKITSSTGAVKLTGYGVMYAEEALSVPQGNSQMQTFIFSGDLDQYEFQVTNFLPDPSRLKVYDVESGQVWRYPKFGLDGRKIVFAQGSFLVPGQMLTLIADQSEGAGYDNSDKNAALLAANSLGSTDATVDKSTAGGGIKLRRPDGVLREIALDNNDNLVIKSTP